VGGFHLRTASGAADRRDRQGRYRIPQRPAAGTRSNELRCVRDAGAVAAERPIVVITSNNEKELPDAFLRRCFFHYIKFPDRETMQAIIDVHFPGIQKVLVKKAMDIFYDLREVPGLKKKPSTSELLDWLKLLLNEDMPLEVLQNSNPAQRDPAPARRAAEERAGRDAVRAAGVHGAAQPVLRRTGRVRSPPSRFNRSCKPARNCPSACRPAPAGRRHCAPPHSCRHRSPDDRPPSCRARPRLWPCGRWPRA
jgi:hypothetical protein